MWTPFASGKPAIRTPQWWPTCNSSAAVKAESDVCCTSANAVKVVEAVDAQQVLFIPDRNLGMWVAKHTKKEIIIYPGFCITHFRVKAENIRAARQAHPAALSSGPPGVPSRGNRDGRRGVKHLADGPVRQ